MEIKKVLVTGEPMFLHRHQFLFKAMAPYFDNLEYLPVAELSEGKILKLFNRIGRKITAIIAPDRVDRSWKNPKTFINRSRKTEQRIRQLGYTPDLIFHVFSLSSPFWDSFDIPYVMYLDYTMSLARKTWSSWAPFDNQEEFAAWFDCERRVYERASYIFTLSKLVKSSLVEDYGIKPEKIKPVGSSGYFPEPYEGEKTFGSKQILFNGSEFKRKGGDLVLAAFKQVKKVIPEAKLVIIGKKLLTSKDGIDNPGHISSPLEMRELFLKTDLVVAPAYCEPYGLFLVEAMNYGVPCIVSANGGMPDIVDDGVNGVVIPQPTSDLLAKNIINLLSDIPRLTEMSLKAQHKVKTVLNWHDIGKNVSQTLLSEI